MLRIVIAEDVGTMIEGSIVAIVTPMHADGEVDYPSLSRLVDFHLESGTDGIVAVGTTGESATLKVEEHLEVVRFVVEKVAGRIPVIAGTGGNATAEAVHLTQEATALGVDACLVVVPYYNKPDQAGMYQHFKTLAEKVDVPQILYNVPGRTVVDMLPETTARLASIDNIIGIKEAEGSFARTQALISQCPDDFIVLSGEDPTACASMLAGGRGVISVTANVAPQLMHEMCRAAMSGDRAAAAMDRRLQPLHKQLFCAPSPSASKWALQQMGLIEAGIRLPLLPLAASHQPVVRQVLIDAGLL